MRRSSPTDKRALFLNALKTRAPLLLASFLAFAAFTGEAAHGATPAGPSALAGVESDGAARTTLNALIAEALANNPELKAAAEGAAAMKRRVKAEGGLEDPTLKVEMEEFSRQSPLPVTPGNAMMTRYTFSQALPFPGKRGLREEIAKREAVGSEYAYKARELEVVRMVKEAAFEASYFDETIRVYKELRAILKEAAAAAESMYATGRAPQLDAIRAAIEAAMVEDSLITAEAEREVASARLKALLGRNQDAGPVESVAVPDKMVALDAAPLIRRAVEKSPEVKAAESEAEAASIRTELAAKTGYPDFMVGGGPVQRDGRVDSFSVMFQVSLPLWGDKNSGVRGEAVSRAASARSMAEAARNKKALEVKGALIMAEGAARQLTLFDSGVVPQAEAAIESALKNYQGGRLPFTSFAEAARTLKKARLDRAKAALDYAARVAALEAAVGEELR